MTQATQNWNLFLYIIFDSGKISQEKHLFNMHTRSTLF